MSVLVVVLFQGVFLSLTLSHLRHVEVHVCLSIVPGPHFITKPMFLRPGRLPDITKYCLMSITMVCLNKILGGLTCMLCHWTFFSFDILTLSFSYLCILHFCACTVHMVFVLLFLLCTSFCFLISSISCPLFYQFDVTMFLFIALPVIAG